MRRDAWTSTERAQARDWLTGARQINRQIASDNEELAELVNSAKDLLPRSSSVPAGGARHAAKVLREERHAFARRIAKSAARNRKPYDPLFSPNVLLEVQARLKTPELRDCLEARSCRNSISAGDAARTAVQEMCSSTRSEAGEAVVVAEVEVLEAPKSPAPDLLKVLELPMKGEADTFEPATEVTVQVTTPTESPPSRKEELAEVLHQMVATADANMQADHHFDSIQANCLELNRFNTDSVSARGAIIECLHHVTDVGKQESESEEGEAGTMANHPQVEQAALANTSEDHPPTREAEEAETHGITQDSQVPLEDVQLHREGGEDCPMGTMELVVQTPPEGPSEPSGRCGSKATCAHETSWDPRPEAKVETGVAQGEADTHGTEGSAEESLDRTEACRWRARAEEEVAPEEQSLLDDLEELAKEVGAEDLEQGLADEMAIGEVKTEETSAEQAEGNGNTSQALTHRPVEEKGAALEHVEPSSEANVAPEHLVIDQPNSGAPTPSAEERTSEPMRSPEDGGPERSRAEAPAESGATVATAHSIEGDQMETQTTHAEAEESQEKSLEPTWPVEPSVEDKVGEQAQASVEAPFVATVAPESAEIDKAERTTCAEQAQEADESRWGSHKPSVQGKSGVEKAQPSADSLTATVEGERAGVDKTEEVAHIEEACSATKGTLEQTVPHEPSMEDTVGAEQAQPAAGATMEVENAVLDKTEEAAKKKHTDEAGETSLEQTGPHESSMKDNTCAEQAEPTVQPSAVASVAIIIEADSAVIDNTEAATHAEADEMSSKPTLPHQLSMENTVGTGSAQSSVEATDATTTVEEHAKIDKTEETSRVAETEETDASTLEQALPHEPAMKDNAVAEQAQQSVEAIVATTAEKSAEIYKKEFEPALPVEPSMEDEVGAEQVQPSAMAPVAITVEADSAMMAKTEAAAHAKQAEEADEMSSKPTLQHQPSMEDRVGTGSAQASVEATDATTTVEENAKIEKTEKTTHAEQADEMKEGRLKQSLPGELSTQVSLAVEQAQPSPEAFLASTEGKEIARHTQKAEADESRSEQSSFVKPSIEDKGCIEQVRQRVEPAVLEPEVEAPREAARSVKNLGLDEAHLDRGSESFTSSGATEAGAGRRWTSTPPFCLLGNVLRTGTPTGKTAGRPRVENEFRVELAKGSKGLGLTVCPDAQNRELLVVQVDPEGAVAQYNSKELARGSAKLILPRITLTQVNGIRGDVEAMVEAMKESGKLDLRVRPVRTQERQERSWSQDLVSIIGAVRAVKNVSRLQRAQ
ncbi:Flagellar attachment zone protein 1 [Durusdinium trenchii]|uniref:Flagellar attachment zone protein 1 n=2 Tax=Durusdinium trenchii TaxID=1381693 RepID=A0ABP0HLC2_9DINO